MIMKKTVFIVPGYKHQPTNRAYVKIAKMLKDQGYLPVPISIPWKQTTISENTDYFLRKFRKKTKVGKKYILGFSYGAVIAFLASTKVRTAGLILCSLSPYFKEDLLKTRNPRFEDYINLNCSTLAKNLKAEKILMLYGEKEDRLLKNRVIDTFSEISNPNKYLIPIRNTEHNIGDSRYLNKIYQEVQRLDYTIN